MLSGFEHLYGFAVCAALHELYRPANLAAEIGGPALVEVQIFARTAAVSPKRIGVLGASAAFASPSANSAASAKTVLPQFMKNCRTIDSRNGTYDDLCRREDQISLTLRR